MPLNIGIIGSGFGTYGLLPAFAGVPNCKVIALCAKKTERVLAACEKFGVKNICEDWHELLSTKNLDAVVIAVNPNAQYEIAKAAIKKGLHVFAEKPLAATLAQARELLDLAEKQKITHGVDFMFPEIDVWAKTKKMLSQKKSEKEFGKLLHVSVNWEFLSYNIKNQKASWKTDVNEGGGVLSFYFSHGLYYLEYFVGKIVDIHGKFFYSPKSINGGEVGIDLEMAFENGVTGSAHVSCNEEKRGRHELLFEYEKGKILLSDQQNDKNSQNSPTITENFSLTTFNKNGVKTTFRSQDITVGKSKDNDERIIIVRRLAARFVKACIENKQMTPSFREGVRVQELIEKIRAEQLAYAEK